MFVIFTEHIDKHGECKFILVSESVKFNWKRMSGHHFTSYPFRNGRGTAAYFIPEAFQSPYSKIGFGATLFCILITPPPWHPAFYFQM